MLPREHYLKQTFQDAVNFPEGFEKGGLSDVQARLIRKHGVLINALMMDEVSDPTTEDQHILKVIANQSAPKSPIEQAWIKYLAIVKTRQASAPAKTKAKPKAAEPRKKAAEPKEKAIETKEKAVEPKPKATATKPAKTTKKAAKTEAS